MSAPYNPWAEQQQSGGDDFSDLDSFGGQYKPEAAFRPGLDAIVNGPVDCEIVSATLERTAKSGDRVCRLVIRVVGGITVDWTQFLTQQSGMNRFCADLAALGFDADKWNTPGRPLSAEVPKAVARLAGIKFRAVKTSREYQNKVYHDLQINGRIDGRPMPPLTPPAAPIPPVAGGGNSAGGDLDIPF